MGLMDILEQYVAGAAAPTAPAGQTEAHFNQVAQQTPPAQLGQGVAAAFRSDATPPFAQMVADLFSRSNPQQQAGLLGQLAQALGPAALAGVGSGALGRLLQGGGQSAAAVQPAAAAQVPATDVSALAARAEQQDPSIVDKLGQFYAAHPTLVQSLGAVALSAVMGHLGQNERR